MIKNLAVLSALFLICSCRGLFAPDEPEPQALPCPDSLSARDSMRVRCSSLKPAILQLDSVSAVQLSVQGAGGCEISHLVFRVLDSAGCLVGYPYIIQFFRTGPDSGGILLNSSDTLENGRVECVYKSGPAAGVCGITAQYAEALGAIIAESRVVPILVSGGPPAAESFTLIPEKRNNPFALGVSVGLLAYAFDRYGNPAQPQMVHFKTNHGGVLPGAALDSTGRAASAYILSGPLPDSMKVHITASTVGSGPALIYASTDLLFSGEPVLRFEVQGGLDTFLLAGGGTAAVRVAVSDKSGHPLSQGTRIMLSLSGGGELLGETDITLPDVLSGYTAFDYKIRDDGSGSRYIYLRAEVSGPNGKASSGIWGKVQ